MNRRARLDTELVRRGLARSREQAAALVEAGRVKVAGRAAVKVATQVMTGEPIVVAPTATGDDYVSRGDAMFAGAKLFRFASEQTYRRTAYAIITLAALVSMPLWDAWLR